MKNKVPPLLEYFEKKGITLKDLVETALELFVPHPGIETEEEAIQLLEEEFLETMSDVNGSCLDVAFFRAQEVAEN